MRHSLWAALAAMLLLAPIGAGSPAANTWAGTWNTDFGPLKLNAGGSGTYYDGKATVSGTIKGNVLEGTWTQPERRGNFKFTMSSDGRSFSGVWNYEGETAMTAGWSGTCAAGPCLENGAPATSAKPSGNTKTVAAPAPGEARAVTSPKSLPTSKKVGVTISSSVCRRTSSVRPRTRAIPAECAPPRGTLIVGEGGTMRREKFGQAVAACWLIGPEGLRLKNPKEIDVKRIRKSYDKATDPKSQLLFCIDVVSILVVTGDINLDLAARTPQGTSGCSVRRLALDGTIRGGRLTSLRPVNAKLRPGDIRYGCVPGRDALKLTVDGRMKGGLRKALGNKLDLGVVRSKNADRDGGRLTFKFGW
jgi:hypothetical protein